MALTIGSGFHFRGRVWDFDGSSPGRVSANKRRRPCPGRRSPAFRFALTARDQARPPVRRNPAALRQVPAQTQGRFRDLEHQARRLQRQRDRRVVVRRGSRSLRRCSCRWRDFRSTAGVWYGGQSRRFLNFLHAVSPGVGEACRPRRPWVRWQAMAGDVPNGGIRRDQRRTPPLGSSSSGVWLLSG